MIAPTTMLLERAIRGWIAEGSELDAKFVIRSKGSGPAPKEEYASCLMIASKPDGSAWSRQGTDPDDQHSYISYTIDYSVQWYRKGAHDRARAFQVWAGSQLGILAAEDRGITFMAASAIRQLDDIVSSKWEERAGLDLTIGIVAVDTRGGLGGIDNVEITIIPNDDTLERRTITPAGA